MTADIEPIVIAEVVNKHGDPEAFAERELVVLANIQALPIGTTLYARYPLREGLPEAWAGIRETLQALALHGDQAELDEVDAKLLLGMLDNPPIDVEGREAVLRSIAVFEQGMQTLTKISNGFLQHALEVILRMATREISPTHREVFPDISERTLAHIAEVARTAIGDGTSEHLTALSATAEVGAALGRVILERAGVTEQPPAPQSDR